MISAAGSCPIPPPPPPPPPPAPTANGGGHEDYTSCEGLRELTLSPPRPSTPLPQPLAQTFFYRPGATLGHVRTRLEDALDGAGYVERGFYCVRNGFALVTRLEQINPDTKAPLPSPRRWNTDPGGLASGFSLQAILEALRRADAGRYRVLVFYVTDKPVTPTSAPPSTLFGQELIERASDELPAELESRPYTDRHRVRVLVYEFQRRSVGAAPTLTRPTLPALVHLQAAGILQRLR